jgi:hypothetical protein
MNEAARSAAMPVGRVICFFGTVRQQAPVQIVMVYRPKEEFFGFPMPGTKPAARLSYILGGFSGLELAAA